MAVELASVGILENQHHGKGQMCCAKQRAALQAHRALKQVSLSGDFGEQRRVKKSQRGQLSYHRGAGHFYTVLDNEHLHL